MLISEEGRRFRRLALVTVAWSSGCAPGQRKSLRERGERERVLSRLFVNYACRRIHKTWPALERELFVASVTLCEVSRFILFRLSRGTLRQTCASALGADREGNERPRLFSRPADCGRRFARDIRDLIYARQSKGNVRRNSSPRESPGVRCRP